MTFNIINKSPYLRVSREFPIGLEKLTQEINKMYIEIASTVNNRTISIFPITTAVVNGESWYLTENLKQQAFRRVYLVPPSLFIDIGFKLSSISQPTKLYGWYLDSVGNWNGIIWGNSTAIAGQLSMYLTVNGASTTSDRINFINGGIPNTYVTGTLVFEWITNP